MKISTFSTCKKEQFPRKLFAEIRYLHANVNGLNLVLFLPGLNYDYLEPFFQYLKVASAFSAGVCHAAATHFLPHCLPCLLERNMDSTRKLKTQVDSHGKRTKSSADRTHPLHYLGNAEPSTVVVLLPRITIRVCQI